MKMKPMFYDFTWPEVFSDPSLVETSAPASLCADALMAWGLCHLVKPPESFGTVLVAIGDKLGVKGGATADNLSAHAVEMGWLDKKD